MSGGTPASELFRGRTIIWIVMAGVIGFALFIMLATYAPDYRPASQVPVPATVQSKAGNGFAGLKKWLEAHDYMVPAPLVRQTFYPDGSSKVTPAPAEERPSPPAPPSPAFKPDGNDRSDAPDAPSMPSDYEGDEEGDRVPMVAPAPPSQSDYPVPDEADDTSDVPLMIVTLEVDAPAERIEQIALGRKYVPTLYILPKYFVRPMKGKNGWVEKVETLPATIATEQLRQIQEAYDLDDKSGTISDWGSTGAPTGAGSIIIDESAVRTKNVWRTIGAGIPIVSTGSERAILSELYSNVYVLADPDLMNNAGLADPNVAHAAIDAIDKIAISNVIVFDTTAHIQGKSKYSLMKLMLEPPFLALTLTILFATLLAVLNGLGRFGPPRVPQRVFAFGKKSLVDMTALMMRRGHKLGGLAPNYAALVRTRAGEALGAPSKLSAEALDQWLEDTDRTEGRDWRTLVREAGSAHGPAQVKSIAKKLYDWKARRISER